MKRILGWLCLAAALCAVVLARRGMAEPVPAPDEEAGWVELHAPLYGEEGPA